ncbi:TetR/AcrR family transcriptional regulator [Actinocorallia sp. A-T 12471]|uniref:TetR/AcrR family transcriptional regulator n=1 Tax=Actinocorallia sp. A-T 12471 TaxID=3089813 RepID=UPI0029D212D7|nr:TetR/AcrR family transcriptional regulator [Actinocorallia sp. A-T 12471]MDX6740017.1 TetR/AcrR family transcriptional regulator [Actinocorallia sp. A-T 12471]
MDIGTRERRAQILAAATDLFARRGYHGVSISELGAAVGLTGPALYRHFKGKEALLAEILLDISTRLHRGGVERVSASADPLDALLDWQISFALDHPALITVHERELPHVPEVPRREIRRIQRAYVEEWVGVVAARMPRPEAETRAAVHATIGLINSTPHSAGGLDRAAMAELLHTMAKAALLAVPVAREAAPGAI